MSKSAALLCRKLLTDPRSEVAETVSAMWLCQTLDLHRMCMVFYIHRNGVMSLSKLSDAELDNAILGIAKEEAVFLQPFQEMNAVFAVERSNPCSRIPGSPHRFGERFEFSFAIDKTDHLPRGRGEFLAVIGNGSDWHWSLLFGFQNEAIGSLPLS